MEEGFYPCDDKGEKVESTPDAWKTDCFVCDRCGRIIEQDMLEVVGIRPLNSLTDQERILTLADAQWLETSKADPARSVSIPEDACLDIASSLEQCYSFVERFWGGDSFHKKQWTRELRSWVSWLRRTVWENRQSVKQLG
jgi:hypothetical protein